MNEKLTTRYVPITDYWRMMYKKTGKRVDTMQAEEIVDLVYSDMSLDEAYAVIDSKFK